MLKQISIHDLTVDMYISEIIETVGVSMPKKKRGMIRDSRIISKFIEIGILQVVIDTDKGLDIIEMESANQGDLTPTDRMHNQQIEEEISRLKQNMSTSYQDITLEWGNAKEIFNTSVNILDKSILAIKNNEKINPDYFSEAGKAISRSIMRNKDALTWLGKIRNKNKYLYEHSVNTSILIGVFAHAYGLNNEQIEQCITGGLLHDLGHAEVEEEILSRPGPLEPDEYKQVKNHVNIGVSLPTSQHEDENIIFKIITEHHERYDGSGYPNALKGEDISLFGRMFAIVDTYDAITNNRVYRDAITSSDGMRTLLKLVGQQFDEALVHKFIKCMGIYPTGSLVRLNNNLLAVVIAQNPQSPLKPLVKVIFNSKSNAYIEPKMLDLMKNNNDEKIIHYEDPGKFDIRINDFMPEEMNA